MSNIFLYAPINSSDDSFKYIKQEFNHKFSYEDYDTNKNNDNLFIPSVYQQIYSYINKLDKNNKIITMSKDNTITTSTITAINEKYITRNEDKFSSNLKILYITPIPFLNTNFNNNIFSDNVISSAMGLSDISLTDHKLLLKPEQIIYLGINPDYTPNDQLMLLDQLEIKFFTMDRIKKIGLQKILKYILKEFENHPIHLAINFSAFNPTISPSVKTFFENYNNTKGFGPSEVQQLIFYLGNKISTIDITGYDINSDLNINDNITNKLIKNILIEIMDLNEKKINVFTEDSRFLIYRPIEQQNSHDVGWYIMRFMTLEQRKEILEVLDDDDIINIAIDDEESEEIDIYVTSTTINEQENLSYYTAQNITDKCLFPPEKMIMLFELLNTPNNDVIHE